MNTAANINTVKVTDLKPMAMRGDCAAQYRLAMHYGTRRRPDYAKAMQWLRLASLQGHAVADYNIGFMHEFGLGTAKDYAKAARAYARAGRQGYPNALNNLGILHAGGLGVERDMAKAVDYWKQASRLGLGEASYNLAMLQMDKSGAISDRQEFFFWVNKAASQGCEKAMAWMEDNAPLLMSVN
ncbi:hypothetical protein FACS1894186_3370 [Alphaproteobacteria bacterium]|nr:hypothetical protein FACS1894186_3370 [Alphaproteobacteria bacterium]